MIKYLYHMDILRDSEEIEVFSPRIPMDILKGENTTMNRICTSTTLEGCIGAAPWGGGLALEFSPEIIFKVYKFDINDIAEGNLITAKELYEKSLVDDASLYDEHWIVNQDIKPCEVFYIHVDDFKHSKEAFIPYKWLKDYKNADTDNKHEYVESEKTVFSDLRYSIVNKEELLFGNTFEFQISELKSFGEYDTVKEQLIELLQYYATSGECDEVIDYEDEDILILETPMTSLGLWKGKLMEELKQICA